MKSHLGQPFNPVNSAVSLLKLVLADECLLYARARYCHSNAMALPGPKAREWFGRQFDEISEIIDDLTLRIEELGGYALGTMSEFLQHAHLEEHRPWMAASSSEAMMRQMIAAHEAIQRKLHTDIEACDQDYGEMELAGLLRLLSQRHEKLAWMLRANLARHRHT